MIRSIIFIFALFVSSTLYAEETMSAQNLEHEFSGAVELGGDKTSGNTESEEISGGLEVSYSYGVWSSDFVFSGIQSFEDAVLTQDYYEAELKVKYAMAYSTYLFALTGYREDSFSGIYSEKKGVAGVGYHAFEDEPSYSVDVEVGYGERVSKKVDRVRLDYDPGFHIGILSEYLFSEEDLVKLNITIEAGNDDDYIKKVLTWEHVLFENLSVNFDYESRTVTKPELGKARSDGNVSVKLGYKF